MLKLKKFNSDSDELIDIVDSISIGRGSDNDIIIKSNDISRHHCLIARDKSKNIFVKDLDSSNGTFVNNKKIDKIFVDHEDILQVGSEKYVFLYVDDAKTLTVEKIVENKPLISSKSLLFNEYTKERIESVTLKLIIDELKSDTEDFLCPCNSLYTIGRLQFCDIVLDDYSVSRTHATIDVRENRVIITDSNSTNGTFVNNDKVTHKVLDDGDTILVGENRFIVTFNISGIKFFNSFKRTTNIITINVLEDFDNILNIYEDEYDKSVLLEVERQTLIFCQEFEQLFNAKKNINMKHDSIVKFIGLLSKSYIIDPTTYKMLAGENIDINLFTPDYIQLIVNLIKERDKEKILYFEDVDPDGSTVIHMNGIYVVVNDDIQLLLMGIPQNNLLYLIYAANWISQIYMHMNEKI